MCIRDRDMAAPARVLIGPADIAFTLMLNFANSLAINATSNGIVSVFLVEAANLVIIQFLLFTTGHAVNNDKSCVFTNVFRFSGRISLLIDSINNDNEDISEPSGIVGVQDPIGLEIHP